MMQVPTGRDRVWSRVNVLAWMRANAMWANEPAELVNQAARAFGVEAMLAAHEQGDGGELEWVWDLAGEVMGPPPVRKEYDPYEVADAMMGIIKEEGV